MNSKKIIATTNKTLEEVLTFEDLMAISVEFEGKKVEGTIIRGSIKRVTGWDKKTNIVTFELTEDCLPAIEAMLNPPRDLHVIGEQESGKYLKNKIIKNYEKTNKDQTDKAIIASDREQIGRLEREIQSFIPTKKYLENISSNNLFISDKRYKHYVRASTAIGRYIVGLEQKIIDIKDKYGWL